MGWFHSSKPRKQTGVYLGAVVGLVAQQSNVIVHFGLNRSGYRTLDAELWFTFAACVYYRL